VNEGLIKKLFWDKMAAIDTKIFFFDLKIAHFLLSTKKVFIKKQNPSFIY